MITLETKKRKGQVGLYLLVGSRTDLAVIRAGIYVYIETHYEIIDSLYNL